MFSIMFFQHRPYIRGNPGNGAGVIVYVDMRKSVFLSLLPLVALLGACEDFGMESEKGKGELRWSVDRSSELFTKASGEIPDTNDFLLSVRDASGNNLYEGSFGDSPEFLSVDEGTYHVSIRSIAFSAPAFARPQYGDDQVVLVKANTSVTVKLNCTLVNCGVRLKVNSNFLTSYPEGVLYLKSDFGRLMYSYSEKRIAYFLPGVVSLTLYNNGKDETLLSRTLGPRDILSLSLSAPAPSSSGSRFEVAVDTTKNWNSETYVIGGASSGNGGEDLADAISVADAAAHAGERNVWVYGYIVGGDLTSAGKSVKTSEITKNTHIAIASRSSVTAKESCVAVELPKGAVRDALNLVDNPGLIGRRVYVRGDLVEAYFGTTGLKSTSDYSLK